MATITVSISKTKIYHIAEGISAMISQHNGGVPSYELLWASPDESKKLDIYYREAISDLERRLMIWGFISSSQYDLTQDADDYSQVIQQSPHWPQRLKGLLDNKIQDYLVHAVTAGWLNDFQGLDVKQDYQAMATQDLEDINAILMMRGFDFQEAERTDDSDIKPEDSGLNPDERKDDGSVKPDAEGLDPEDRKADGSVKPEPEGLTPEKRKSDADKATPLPNAEAGYRRKDNVTKLSADDIPPYCKPKNLRHRDNDIVEKHPDWTDWSGSDYRALDRPRQSVRVRHGMGYTPNPYDERLVPPVPPVTPPSGMAPHPVKPHHKDPRIPDNPTHPNYPPIKANGVGWSDDPLYDEKGSEHYING